MSDFDFDKIIQAAAKAKVQQEAETKAKLEEAQQARRDAEDRQQKRLEERALPVLRKFLESLRKAHIPVEPNFNANVPTMSKWLMIGHSNAPATARKVSLRLTPAEDSLGIVVGSNNAPEREWKVTWSDPETVIAEACEDALNRWHGIKGYR